MYYKGYYNNETNPILILARLFKLEIDENRLFDYIIKTIDYYYPCVEIYDKKEDIIHKASFVSSDNELYIKRSIAFRFGHDMCLEFEKKIPLCDEDEYSEQHPLVVPIIYYGKTDYIEIDEGFPYWDMEGWASVERTSIEHENEEEIYSYEIYESRINFSEKEWKHEEMIEFKTDVKITGSIKIILTEENCILEFDDGYKVAITYNEQSDFYCGRLVSEHIDYLYRNTEIERKISKDELSRIINIIRTINDGISKLEPIDYIDKDLSQIQDEIIKSYASVSREISRTMALIAPDSAQDKIMHHKN